MSALIHLVLDHTTTSDAKLILVRALTSEELAELDLATDEAVGRVEPEIEPE